MILRQLFRTELLCGSVLLSACGAGYEWSNASTLSSIACGKWLHWHPLRTIETIESHRSRRVRKMQGSPVKPSYARVALAQSFRSLISRTSQRVFHAETSA